MRLRETRWTIGRHARSLGPIVAGDVLAIVAFLSYGLTIHGINPLQFPRHTVLASLPFVLSWLVLAPIGGLYRPRTRRSARATFVRLITVWIGVSLLGGAVRSMSWLPGEAPPVFLLVVFVFGAGVLLPWRLLVVFAEHVRPNHQGWTGKTDQT